MKGTFVWDNSLSPFKRETSHLSWMNTTWMYISLSVHFDAYGLWNQSDAEKNLVIIESRDDFLSLPHVHPQLGVATITKFGKFDHLSSFLRFMYIYLSW